MNKDLPPDARESVDAVVGALARAVADPDNADASFADAVRNLDDAIRVIASSRRPGRPVTARETTFAEILAENLATLRHRAKWTQAEVAEAMSSLGFDWERQTVTHLEAKGRRITFGELVGLAVLFAVPVVDLVLPDDNELTLIAIDEAATCASGCEIRELFLGRGGATGNGGRDWAVAARLAGRTERPAADV